MPRGTPENLVQNRDFSPEQRREWSRKAGLARGAQLHRQKRQREILKEILSLTCDDPETERKLEQLGLDPTFAGAMNMAVVQRAMRGDVEAVRYIRDTLGEKPSESINLGVYDTPVKSLDLTKLSDAELEALADRADSEAE